MLHIKSLVKKTRTLFKVNWAFRMLLAEAFVLLGVGRMSVLIISFRKIATWMGEVGKESSASINPSQTHQLIQVGSAIETISKYTPWKSNCFAQALCSHWILKRKGIDHTIYFGVQKDAMKTIKAHAWLRANERIVTGRKGHKSFTVVGKFAFLKESTV